VPNMSYRPKKDNHKCKHTFDLANPDFFRTYIQPIFSLHDLSTYGYEVLNRPNGIPAEQFYDEIIDCGCYHDVDRFLVNRSLTVATQLPGSTFINVFPPTLLDLPVSHLDNTNVVFELNERTSMDGSRKVLSEIVEKPLTIAIDDVCQGSSGLRSIIEMNPSYIKLDKWLISGIESSTRKCHLVKLLVEYSAGQSKIIAEGVEHSAELDVIRSLGVDYAQGYLLSKPQLFVMAEAENLCE
jgi:EAL domain-containing protein (putative c-di-GMP-specific phosphodiesterase class I)